MKLIIKLSLMGFIILMMSCQKFLQENPPSNYTPDSYYSNAIQAQNAVNGIYAYTQPLYTQAQGGGFDDYDMLFLEMPNGQTTADIKQGLNNKDLLNLVPGAADLYSKNWWKLCYQGINAANLAITNIPNIPATLLADQPKAQLMGQAQFLRAWYYFNLVRIFGDVPLITTPTTSATGLQVPKNTTQDIYEKLIVPDLLSAEQSGLPFADHTGRVSLGAVKSLLAKVYETMAGYPLQQKDKFALAKQKAADVINSGQFTLYTQYSQFSDPANDNLLENIWMVQFAGSITASIMFNITIPLYAKISAANQGSGLLVPDPTFYASYQANDLRKQEGQYFYSHYANDKTGVDVSFTKFPTTQHLFKYFDKVSYSTGAPSSKCFPVLRLSDIMLLYAEAQNEADGSPDAKAYQYLNAIRTRAQLPALSGLSQDQFRQAVWRERAHELCYENITWFDMVRTRMAYDTKHDTFVPLVGYQYPTIEAPTFQTKNLLMPIPQSEIQANNKLTQNPGYD